ncbi:proton-conducting transporter membrane subunit [Agrococcus sp. SCSIO52902]|uniref:proton-conducting transporter transmembrane domain-containing protein n=1 Tax=Agrococcus sp. SCSIO52902 TaxID=2933290 RepID=UPI001FF2A782|nr:proton-conducting transporter membrane subunit [Agrococcus sp. SCSIO52902]UOW01056.1 NADH-quinone oxidoreductase subunit L [Agrococcus sp. SCSIO52902]
MSATIALWLLVLLPATTGALLCLLPRVERVAGVVAIGVATAGLALAVVVATAQPAAAVPFLAGAGFDLRVDGLSAIMLPTVAAVTLLVLIFAAGDIREGRARFHGLMLIFAAAALLTAVAGNLVTLLFAWEVMGATSFALIGFWWRDEHRVASGTTAFITTRAGDLGLYAAAGAALGGGAGLGLAELTDATAGWRDAAAAGLLVAALGKAAQLPFSFWLSRAMDGPSPVSALLHSAAMVAMGGYLLLRVAPLLESTGWADTAAAWIGAVTALLLGAVAVAQRDVKQLLAASTAAQLGFVVLAAGLGAQSGGVAHLVAHASTKAALFIAAGAWLTALGTRRLSGLAGAARRWRLLGLSASLAALALAGIPPLSLWATKDAVLTAALEESLWLYIVGLAASALSAVYAAKLIFAIWRRADAHTATHYDEHEQGTRHAGALDSVPVAALAVGAAVLGMLALPPLSGAVARALGQERAQPGVWELIASGTIALVLVLASTRWRLPEPRWAAGWLGLELAADRLLVRPTMRLAARLARFDDAGIDAAAERAAEGAAAIARGAASLDDSGIDAAADGAAAAAMTTARAAASLDDRGVDRSVDGFARRVWRAGRDSARAQNGQLHHYYAQAVGLLGAVVVLLLVIGR